MPIARDQPDATPDAPACVVAIKAVPGAKRDEIVGRIGDRLKVRVSAPPENGKANKAIEALVAQAVGVPARDVSVVRGHASPEKSIRIAGTAAARVEELFP
jgi:uncharacterized protein (TIGR00251 family)